MNFKQELAMGGSEAALGTSVAQFPASPLSHCVAVAATMQSYEESVLEDLFTWVFR